MISIIIPTLNEEKYLPRLLESIKNQDYTGEIEIIVADAQSKDETREIARSFGCRVIEGGLPAKARNQGARASGGDILLFVDADGFLPVDFISKASREMERRNLYVAGFFCVPDDNAFIFRLILGVYNFWSMMLEKFSGYGANAILIRKDIHQKIGGFDETVMLSEDHLYIRKAKRFGKYGLIKGTKAYINMRRFKKEGVFKTCLKYLSADLYTSFIGPIRKDIFKYKFGHYDEGLR